MIRHIHAFVVFSVVAILAGCGGGSSANLGLVEGTVTLDNVPVEGANVEFQPAQGSASYGVTNASGRYELYFAGDTKGAEVGQHTVRITTPSPSEDDPRQYPQIPAKYNTATELTETVEKGKNTIDFPLAAN